jgi:hypothetical protein
MTEPIRIPFLHPRAICPPGIVYKCREGDGSIALNQHPDEGPWIECHDITDFDEDANVPEDLTGPEVMAVLRALAERYPEHVVVAADEVRSRFGEPEIQAWRHPDDVEAIEHAWIHWLYWRDAVAAAQAIESRVSDQRRAELLVDAKRQEAAESGYTPIADSLGGVR